MKDDVKEMNCKIGKIKKLASLSAKARNADAGNMTAAELMACLRLLCENRKNIVEMKKQFLKQAKSKFHVLTPVLEDDTSRFSKNAVLRVHKRCRGDLKFMTIGLNAHGPTYKAFRT